MIHVNSIGKASSKASISSIIGSNHFYHWNIGSMSVVMRSIGIAISFVPAHCPPLDANAVHKHLRICGIFSKFPVSGPCCIKLKLKGRLPNHPNDNCIRTHQEKKEHSTSSNLNLYKSFHHVPKYAGFKRNSFDF